ncbi:MAG TPA: hypothetical protein PKA27_04380 [Fimbriimonadaceae bacterium]|nr:hypothetical protein [Fimbriimonadaceae bacterium]
MIFVWQPPDPTQVFRDFGYPSPAPVLVRRTESGGAEYRSGPVSITIDKAGIPHVLKIPKVRFERSRATATIKRIKVLLDKYPIALPTGRWVTERSLAAHPYGAALSSMRYFYVPTLHGIPFLRRSEMTVQFSSDSKRVLEWYIYRGPKPSARLPKSYLTATEVVQRVRRLANKAIEPRKSITSFIIGQPELGWWGTPTRLAYQVGVTFVVHHPGGRRGSGSAWLIDAVTGQPISTR